MYLLVARPLWFDEIFTAWAARLPLPRLLDALRLDSGPPGFYVLEKPFAAAAGGADWMLRVPSFLAACACLFAAKTLPRPSRPWFLAFASGSALVTLYAAEARPYALLGLLALVAFLLSLTGPESPARLAGLALAAAGAFYTHYLAIFAVAALVAIALGARRLRSAAALLGGAAAFLPWMPILRAQPREAIAWVREPAAGTVAGFLSALGGVGRIPAPFGGPAPGLLFVVGVLAGIVLLAALAASAFRQGDMETRRALLFVVLVLLGVLGANAWRPVAFAGRTEMAVLPIWIWGAARAASANRFARWGTAAASVCGTAVVFVVAFLPRATATPPVTSALAAAARPGDVVVAAAGFYLPLRLEAERGRLAAEVRALPEEASHHPGWFVPALPTPRDTEGLARESASLPPGGRLFLVVPPAYATPELVAALEGSDGKTRELARSRDVLVLLKTRGSRLPADPSAP